MSTVTKPKEREVTPEVIAAEETLVFLNGEINKARAKLDEVEQFASKGNVEVQHQIDELHREFTTLQHKIADAQLTCDSLECQLSELTDQVEAKQKAISELSALEFDLRGCVSKLTDEKNTLLESIENLDSSVNAMKKAAEEKRREYDQKLSLLDKRAIEIAKETEVLEWAGKETDRREAAVVSRETQNQDMIRSLQERETAIKNGESVLKQKEDDMAKKKSEIDSMRESIDNEYGIISKKQWDDYNGKNADVTKREQEVIAKEIDIAKRDREYFMRNEELKVRERMVKVREKALNIPDQANDTL